MSRDDAPPELTTLADARAAARRDRDWATADALKARIEAAGWKVIDTGSFYDLERAAAPDIEAGGIVRYGSSGSVPSRLAEAPVGVATVVLVVTGQARDLARAVGAIGDHAPDGTRVVVVANGAPDDIEGVVAVLDSTDPGAPGVVTEVLRTSERLGWAAALNAGIRRATAPLVLVLDPSIELVGDLVTVLADALEDPGVAVAGPAGLVSDDLRAFRAAARTRPTRMPSKASPWPSGGPTTWSGARSTSTSSTSASLDAWWSLVLRDQADDDRRGRPAGGRQPSRSGRRWSSVTRDTNQASRPQAERERQARRNRYRLLKRFATRRDLLGGPGRPNEPAHGSLSRQRPRG